MEGVVFSIAAAGTLTSSVPFLNGVRCFKVVLGIGDV